MQARASRICFLVLACSVSYAASAADPAAANPTFANPDTPGLLDGKPAANVPNVTDMVFLKQFALGGRAEVELGKLADERAAAPQVDAFGRDMVKDHGDANAKLAALARSTRVELPKELDAEHAAVRAELAGLRGREFDLRYAGSQVTDHQKAAQLLMYEIAQGQHAGVRKYASDTLPTVMEHLALARAMHDELTGVAAKAPPPKAAQR